MSIRPAALPQVLFICLFCAAKIAGQSTAYTAFTVNDGLPSNNVYRVLEDDKGFLWIATDAGVARFDGKNFQRYTTRNGLPDNEVFYLEKERDGRIWIGAWKQIPAYFDEVRNRFVTPFDEKMQRWFEDTGMTALTPLKDGGMRYANRNHYVIFHNGKVTKFGLNTGRFEDTMIEDFPDGTSITWHTWKDHSHHQITSSLYYYKGSVPTDSVQVQKEGESSDLSGHINDGNVYLFRRNDPRCVVLSGIEAHPMRYKRDTIHVPEPFIDGFFTRRYFYFTAHSGKIYVYDKKTLQPVSVVGGDYIPNCFGEDRKDNWYVGTVDKGLVVYRSSPLRQVEMPDRYTHTNFRSIARRADGTLFAGNYHGEIVEIGKGKSTVHKTNNIVAAKIRKILFSGNDIYTFSEQGIYRNYTQRLLIPRVKGFSFAKTALSYNDSFILIGTNYGLVKLDTRTQATRELLPCDIKKVVRVTSMVKAGEPSVYFGSSNGLYEYDYEAGTYVSRDNLHPALKNRISALGYTPDGLLWVATADNRILVLEDNKVVIDASIGDAADGSIRCITAGKPGHTWISTSNGITVIQYRRENGKFVYDRHRIAIGDGLASNDVQELLYGNGSFYAATSHGISIIPDSYRTSVIPIPTYLVRMRINQDDAPISDRYQVDYGQQDIQMQFAGVDLDGRFGHLQYRLDDHPRWIDLSQNTLNIQLRTGVHKLEIRAVDVNGNISSEVRVIRFDVAVPFWQSAWFWIALGTLMQVVLYYSISRYLKRKKEARLARKIALVQTAALEQQAFTSLMNPHFIFNALNSIQHYINVQDRKGANRYLSDFASLIRRNFDAAQQSFIPLEEEIENARIYLSLEKMRFNDRFDYAFQIKDDLEPDDWMIPTMILQPLLENALLHGIMPSSVHGELTIGLQQRNQELLIEITDNGIGMENSRTLKKDDVHKSSGIALIYKRIAALGNLGSHPPSITMRPAFDSPANPGNKAIIIIPATLYAAWRNHGGAQP